MRKQQPYGGLWNPMINVLQDELPKKYRRMIKKSSSQLPKFPRSLSSNHKCSFNSYEKNYPLLSSKNQQINKKGSQFKDFSIPKRLIFNDQKYSGLESLKLCEKRNSKPHLKCIKRKFKLLPLKSDQKLDDKESAHKVFLKNRDISHSVMEGVQLGIEQKRRLDGFSDNQQNNVGNDKIQIQQLQKKRKFHTESMQIESNLYEVKVENFHYKQKKIQEMPSQNKKIESEQKFIENNQIIGRKITKQKVQVSTQINIAEDLLKYESQKEEPYRSFRKNENLKKQMINQMVQEKQQEKEKIVWYPNAQAENSVDQKQIKQKQGKKGRNSSTPVSLSTQIEKQKQVKKQTKFKKLNSKKMQDNICQKIPQQENKIPKKNEYSSYLQNYKPLNENQFNMRDLIHSSAFAILEEDGNVYFGECEENEKNGKGLLLTSKKILQGKFSRNTLIEGCEKTFDGIYQGSFMNGKRQGHGRFTWNNGELYEGNWKNGMKDGFGVWKSPKGDYYEGEWRRNRQQGKGTFQHKNSLYEGEFKNFVKNGIGEEVFSNGDKYIGNYLNGKPDGKGKYYWADGSFYDGEFVKGMREGFGQLKAIDHFHYEGYFFNDLKHGKGKQTYPSGRKISGIFQQGQIKQENKQQML